MEYAACVVPAAPVRKRATHKCEMVNQLLFGETMEVLKIKKEEWLKVRSLHDKYEGWIQVNMVEPIEESLAKEYNSWVVGEIINTLHPGEIKMDVSVGSSLLGYEGGEGRFGNFEYQFWDTCYRRNDVRPQPDIIKQLVQVWMNAPYMWGGRTPLGVDCSGFTQVIFKMMGIDLWRDAYLQAEQGIKIDSLTDVQCGDLAFFNDKKNRIDHVGILLNEQQIIHSSGKVRIDSIDDKGITNTDTGKKTHRLKIIRRFW